jgi:hypothetical protein
MTLGSTGSSDRSQVHATINFASAITRSLSLPVLMTSSINSRRHTLIRVN